MTETEEARPDTPMPPPPGSGIQGAYPALRWRNFRIYIPGQAASLIGMSMQTVAANWLIYRLSRSELSLGVYGFITELPNILVVLFSGVIADRGNARRILVVAQALAMVQAVTLAALFFLGRINLPILFAFGCFLGIVNSFSVPSRHVLVPQMVEAREDIPSALALSSFALDAAKLAGPALAGMLIASLGEGACFLSNALGAAVLIFALLSLRLNPHQRAAVSDGFFRSLGQGVRYAYGRPQIRSVLLLIACLSFGGSASAVLLPVMAALVLKGGPQTLGLLSASTGLGSLAGAIFLGMRRGRIEHKTAMSAGALGYGLGLAFFSQSTSAGLSALLLSITGFGVMIMMVSGQTIMYAATEADKRGKVMSLFSLSFMGIVPVGSLCSGFLARSIGAPSTIAAGSVICLLGALFFLRQQRSAGAAPEEGHQTIDRQARRP